MKNRRDFLKKAGRIIFLSAIGYGTVWGIRREKITLNSRAFCGEATGCGGCSKLVGCNKVVANDFRSQRNSQK